MEQIIDKKGRTAVRRVIAIVVGSVVHEILTCTVQPEVRHGIIGIYPHAQEAVVCQELTAEETRKTFTLAALIASLEPPLVLCHHKDFGDFRDEEIAQICRVVAVTLALCLELDRRRGGRPAPTRAVALR